MQLFDLLQALQTKSVTCEVAAASGLLSLCLRCLASADDELRSVPGHMQSSSLTWHL